MIKQNTIEMSFSGVWNVCLLGFIGRPSAMAALRNHRVSRDATSFENTSEELKMGLDSDKQKHPDWQWWLILAFPQSWFFHDILLESRLCWFSLHSNHGQWSMIMALKRTHVHPWKSTNRGRYMEDFSKTMIVHATNATNSVTRLYRRFMLWNLQKVFWI